MKSNQMNAITKRIPSPVLILFLLGLCLRLLWIFFTDNCYEGDALARLNWAWEWRCNPSWFPSVDWMPLYHYIFGSILYLFNEPYWTPRIVNVCIGAITLVVHFKVIEKEFDHTVALWCTALLSFYHTHIFINGVTEAESLFILLTLCVIYAIQEWQENRQFSFLILAALFLNLGSLLRFEGWIFLLVVAGWVWYKKHEMQPVIWLLSLGLIAPSWEIYQMWLKTGDPLWGITFSDFENARQYESNPVTLLQRLLMFCISFQPLLLIILPFALKQKAKTYFHQAWWVIAIIPTSIAFYKLMSGSLQPTIRYFALYAILLAPYSIEFIIGKFKKIKRSELYITLIVIVPTLLFLPFITYLYSFDNPIRFPKGYINSTEFAYRYLSNSRLMLDQDKYMLGHGWGAYAHARSVDGGDTNSRGIVWRINGKFWLGESFNSSNFENELVKIKPTHLVLFKNGYLSNHLRFTKSEEHYGQYLFLRVFSDQGYQIYQVTDH